MIQVRISEIKNRLSHYLQLVRGGEVVEILDRRTPVARLVHVSRTAQQGGETSWVREMERLGIVAPPSESGFPPGFFSGGKPVAGRKKAPAAVLKALLEEREGER